MKTANDWEGRKEGRKGSEWLDSKKKRRLGFEGGKVEFYCETIVADGNEELVGEGRRDRDSARWQKQRLAVEAALSPLGP